MHDMWHLPDKKQHFTCYYAPPTLKGKKGLTSVYKENILSLVTQVMTSACLEFKLRPLNDYLSSVSVWYGYNKDNFELQDFTRSKFWRHFICKIVKGVRQT